MSAEVCEAVRWLRGGGVISHACEGVWGFACDPFDEAVVQRILAIKQRPISKGLIVIAHAASCFEPELARLSMARRQVIESTWPGRTTWLLPTSRFPKWVIGDFETVAVRVPGHKQARTIAAKFQQPMISTSANVASEPPCQTEQEVREKFADIVDFVVPGQINNTSGPSEIRDASTDARIR